MDIGLTLPNRGVMLDIITAAELIRMAEIAEKCGEFRSVWVGDSLLGKPRLESISLLSAVAARTETIRIGVACMASFVIRDPILFAYQWASLDIIANGRTVFVGCTGIIGQEGGKKEADQYGLDLLVKSKISPVALAAFFRKLKREVGSYNENLEMLMTHPHFNSRIKAAIQYELPENFEPSEFELDWEKVQESIGGKDS